MTRPLRCAIYTRKSTEEGLEQDFNSLDAQREACAAYITSQRHEGWTLVPAQYDDGGFSGGSMERPALQALLSDLAAGAIDTVVVYKVDRLTRSLTDFAAIVATLDQAGASFVSVTQAFNTTTSMGRLTLNVLLSFAQFEREVTAERIRDKIAASKAKGIWMGGVPPIGYRVESRRLIIVPEEADLVRHLFDRYLTLKSVRLLQAELEQSGIRTPHRVSRTGRQSGDAPFSKGKLYWVLSNPIVIGKIRHRETIYAGLHEPIIDLEIWERTQTLLAENRRCHVARSRARHPSPLAGKLFDPAGQQMRPVHARKNGKRYRYYVSPRLIDSSIEAGGSGWRIPGREIEAVLAQAIRTRLADPDLRCDLLARSPAGETSTRLVAALDGGITRLQDTNDKACCALLRDITDQVSLYETRLEATITLGPLLDRPAAAPASSSHQLEITAPIALARRGAELKLILQGAAGTPALPDPGLVQTMLDARRRFARYTDPDGPMSISAIAAAENTDPGDVSRSLQLAFLAPDLIEAILNGRQPAQLTATKLLRLEKLPLIWEEQRQVLS